MDSNKINQLEAQVKLLKQKLLKSQLDFNFKDLQIKSLKDEIESQNQKIKSLEDEFKTQKKNHENILNQFHIDSQKIIEEAFSESSPITPPQNYTDPMIETNQKKRKFE
jgi:DNA repair exonuclease SbcCD ATPase subunit